MHSSALAALELLAGEWEPLAPTPLTSVSLPPLHEVDALYCIGFDPAVHEQARLWLQGKGHRRLIFLEPRGPVLAHLMRFKGPWIDDPQVELHFMPKPLDGANLARANPFQKIETMVLPGLPLFRSQRLTLKRRTLRAHFQFVDQLQCATLWRNTLRNLAHLPRSFYANKLEGRYKAIPAIIVGAGPSLEQDIPMLKRLQTRALILAGGSAIRALGAHGIAPHFAVAIDPNAEEKERLETPFAVPLLYSTRLHPDALSAWRGPLGYVRAGIGGMPEAWCEAKLGLTGKVLPIDRQSFTVTPVAVALAEMFGCSSATLVGVDLAYTGGRRYATGVIGLEAREPMQQKGRDVQGQEIATSLLWKMEAQSLSRTARRFPLFNASSGLAIAGVPHRPLSIQDFPIEVQLPQIEVPMPPLEVGPLLEECRVSLRQILAHVEVLAGESSSGAKALAEVELQEEALFGPLFAEFNELMPSLLKITGRPFKDRWILIAELIKLFRL